ncbi:hypothetical protein QCA50_013205 [Cerrena zonata]|uniref:WH1 domain-containing protein n=1 Tax=Cerrena zonata TaxID=2478898 RepID=A0AAW0G087_9APHY
MTLSNDIKHRIQTYLPTDARILATASACVYHAPFGGRPTSWSQSGLSGILVFGRDRLTLRPDRRLGVGPGSTLEQNFWFRLIDLNSGKGLIWMHQIADDLDYRLDKPFFHEFRGKTRMFGFRFDEDAEANKFYKKVTSHIHAAASSRARMLKPKNSFGSFSNFNPLKRLTPSLISPPAPGTFVHLSHVGFDKKGRVEVSDGIEEGWTIMVEELKGHGVDDTMVEDDRSFVEGFWAGVKATSPKEAKIKLDKEQGVERKRKTIRRKPVGLNTNMNNA